MGFFSWKTSDTRESISNIYSSRGSKTVYLYLPSGEQIEEKFYKGYGVFGGLDVFIQLAKQNGFKGDDEYLRDMGIELDCEQKNVEYPLKFSFSNSLSYKDLDPAECCNQQGFFYD